MLEPKLAYVLVTGTNGLHRKSFMYEIRNPNRSPILLEEVQVNVLSCHFKNQKHILPLRSTRDSGHSMRRGILNLNIKRANKDMCFLIINNIKSIPNVPIK